MDDLEAKNTSNCVAFTPLATGTTRCRTSSRVSLRGLKSFGEKQNRAHSIQRSMYGIYIGLVQQSWREAVALEQSQMRRSISVHSIRHTFKVWWWWGEDDLLHSSLE